HLSKIFLPFEQVGNVNKQAEGTGLGLAISHQIVEMMGGQLQVSSKLGEGSVFWFDINLPEASDWAENSQFFLTDTSKIVGYEGGQRQILVVDDRWENRSVIVNLLEPLGFKLLEAENGQEGLAKAIAERPDVIITDLSMPIMGGYEFLLALQESAEIDYEVVTIVSSASVFESDRQKSIDVGASDFLPKPIQAESLLQSLQQHLNLEWTYQTQSESTTRQQNITGETIESVAIIPPPSEEINLLYDLSRKGLLQNIHRELERIEQLDDKYLPFVQTMRKLANGYKLKKIRSLLEQYL
ncbi:MAG: response regulator, partial [Pleurocapsa sp.]